RDEIVVAEEQFVKNKTTVGAGEMTRAEALSSSTQRTPLRAMTTIAASRLKIAQKESRAALQNLQSLLGTLKRTGDVALQLETRLVQCEAELQSNQTSAARTCLTALQKDSEARGFKRVAQKAQNLAR